MESWTYKIMIGILFIEIGGLCVKSLNKSPLDRNNARVSYCQNIDHQWVLEVVSRDGTNYYSTNRYDGPGLLMIDSNYMKHSLGVTVTNYIENGTNFIDYIFTNSVTLDISRDGVILQKNSDN